MTLYIHIWLCHHLGHAITNIKHLGRGKDLFGSFWLPWQLKYAVSQTVRSLCSSTFDITAVFSFLFQKLRVGAILKQPSSE